MVSVVQLFPHAAQSGAAALGPLADGLAAPERALASIGMDPATRAAGILFAAPKHLEGGETLEERFGEEVAALAGGVEKLFRLSIGIESIGKLKRPARVRGRRAPGGCVREGSACGGFGRSLAFLRGFERCAIAL